MRNGKRRGGGEIVKPSSAFTGLKGLSVFLFLLSGVLSVLALTGSMYMLQIYDRALTSQSVPTLIALSLLAIGLYAFYGVLDATRSQILIRLAAQFDARLSPLAHRVSIDMPRFGYSVAEARERGRDVETVRSFMSGPGPQAMLDMPWVPLYIGFVYLLHPWLGMLAIAGALILSLLTLLTELVTRNRSQSTFKAELARANILDANTRNSEIIHAMGFADRAIARFEKANAEYLRTQTGTTDFAGTLGGISKVLRMILQSAVLGLGAYLTIKGELTAGAIIAASVASARALSPVDTAIGQWKSFVAARRGWKRLGETLASLDDRDLHVDLPKPAQSLEVSKITVAAPGSGTVVVSDIGFDLVAGQALGIVGPSGCGKSTLARALIGVWPLVRGSVRLDGAELAQWDPSALGRHIGYVPQDVALLDATVAENISRFDLDPSSDKILAAARAAGVHEMIVRLPNGYQSELGPHGTALSAGQRQRIALARALYDNPFLVVLDEPNSNLDAEGEAALTAAIESVKARGGIAIVIAHRPSAISACDLVAVIRDGRLAAMGPREEIISGHTRSARPDAAPRKTARIATPSTVA